MKIGNVKIKSNIFLAPMAGVSDFAFRSLARKFGAGLSYTEMVSAKGLVLSKNRDIYKKMLYTLPNERPKAVQIFGNDASIMAQACKLPELQKFDIIDINMGCPAPKIVKNKEGSALLCNIDLAVKIAKACVESTNKPITVKMRIGFKESDFVAVEFAKKLEEVGVKAITIHGRTKEQMYSGKVNYDAIKKVKEAVNIPVIANGDIVDCENLNKMKDTGADAFMIARGSMGRPWIFAELNNKKISNRKKYKTILQHIKLLQKIYSEKFLTTYFRKHLLWYVKGIPCASQYKLELAKIENLDKAKEILRKIFLSN